MKIFVTGGKGFISGYLIQQLLDKKHHVVSIDNFSKYGRVEKSYDNCPNYKFVEGDAKNVGLMKELVSDCDHIIASAAIIGGISMFHEKAYDLLAENERIMASTFDAAIWAFKYKHLKKITVLSSSMVFENTNNFPTSEDEQLKSPPPSSTYGFQKLACEYFCKGAWEQYQLPYTILRPFNAIGIGEYRALCDSKIMSGNIKLAMSHVVIDLIQKILKGQNPLHILGNGNQIRHYTYAGDLARGIIMSLDNENALNNDFNLSTLTGHTVIELAKILWYKIREDEFSYICDKPFKYDIQKRVPDISKAKKILGFEATTSLDTALNEIIPWCEKMITLGTI